MKVTNFEEYQEFVWKLASDVSKSDFEHQLGTAGLGLAGESGEVADLIKKVLFQGKKFDKEKFIDELSDVMWYMSFAASVAGVTMEDVMQVNVKKLSDRYKSGKFTQKEFEKKEASKNFDLKSFIRGMWNDVFDS